MSTQLFSLPDIIPTFKGSDLEYHEIAFRGNDILGVNFSYGVNPHTDIGFLICRFVLLAEGAYLELAAKKMNKLQVRGQGSYTRNGQNVSGLKFNILSIKLFENAGCPHLGQTLGDKFQVWPKLGEYIASILNDENFTLSVFDLNGFIRDQFKTPINDAVLTFEAPVLTGAKNTQE
jgi:hypothetical protein